MNLNERSTNPKTTMDAKRRVRVKLYVLNDQRVWDDRGTGHVSCVQLDRTGAWTLVVRSENEGGILLESKLLVDTVYQKQQETLIVWSEGDNYDLALSFQEKAGCDEIWEKICQAQGKDPTAAELSQDLGYENESDSENGEATEPVRVQSPGTSVQLPPCELSRLADVNDALAAAANSPVRREQLALAVENEGYVKKLLQVFHMAEDLESMESLHLLYSIFKNIFMLNKNALFEILFSDECLYDVVGVLEYDPVSETPRRHRDYLWRTAKFREVVPIATPDLKAKIHQTFRVQYIQDVILPAPSVFEENVLSTLSSFIFFNKVEIVSLVQDDEQFLNQLFGLMSSQDTPLDKRKDAILFLKEFCSFSQTLQPQARETFFRTVSSHGILPAVETCLASDDDQTRAAAIEIFANVVEFNPAMVRDYMLVQCRTRPDDERLFMNVVIHQMFIDKDPELGGAVQLAGILRVLLDPENMMQTAPNKTEKTEFLAFFYKRCMSNLCAPLLANTADDKLAKDDYHTAHILSVLLDLLTFCIEHHTYHIRNYILNKDILKRVLSLLKSKHAFLALCALRFLRRIIQLKDDFYNRYIVRQKLFGPVVDCFGLNGHKYNLLNSAMLELFEFIRLEDVKILCQYIVENHTEAFKDVNYVSTFKSLVQRYEQQQDREANRSSNFGGSGFRSPAVTPPAPRFRRDPRELDEDEDKYFEEEEWEDENLPHLPTLSKTSTPPPPTSPGGSVPPRTPSPNAAPPLRPSSPTPPSTFSNSLGKSALQQGVVAANRATSSPPGNASGKTTTSNFFTTELTSEEPSLSPLQGTGVKFTLRNSRVLGEASRLGRVSSTTASSNSLNSTPVLSLGKRGLVDYDLEDSDSEEDDSQAECVARENCADMQSAEYTPSTAIKPATKRTFTESTSGQESPDSSSSGPEEPHSSGDDMVDISAVPVKRARVVDSQE